ncbi:MAG: PepSY domain-containing protein, partial [Oscillospiraceae bacterium]|nr:PepSY domain-containing protein [Oscillospiraceae bacterium]
KLDRDDGVYVYEVEFTVGWLEYEYEIDAASGSILSFEIDD